MITRRPDRRTKDIVALRLLQILDGIEQAGFAPASFRMLHSFAYLGNLLSPLWEVDPLDGKILKLGYPYYPELREAIDRLAFNGLLELTGFKAILVDGRWVGEGEVGLNIDLARPILYRMDIFEDERRTRDFLLRLAFALAPKAEELCELVMTDVTWTDNRTGRGDVLDFAEYKDANYSFNTALAFERLLPKEMLSTRGEKLQFYVRMLEKRMVERMKDVA